MKRVGLTLLVCLSGIFLWPEKITVLPELQKPNAVLADSTQLYIADGESVLIYSIKDLKLRKKFGRKGEGPEEFKVSPMGVKIRLFREQILVESVHRLSIFTKEGRFIRQRELGMGGLDLRPMENKFVGVALVNDKNGKAHVVFALYDKDLKKEKELSRYPYQSYRDKVINPFDLRGYSAHVYSNKIFIDDKMGNINVYDAGGTKIRTIKPRIKKTRVSKGQKERLLKQLQIGLFRQLYEQFKSRIRFPDHSPPIRDFCVSDDSIYIITNTEKDGKSVMMVLSLEGKLQKKKLVPLLETDIIVPMFYNYYTINNNKIYRLVDNPEENCWELHVSDINDLRDLKN